MEQRFYRIKYTDSCDYNIDEMLSGVAEELPDIPLIGNTSFTGIITPEGYISSQDGFVGVMALSDPDMIVGIASKERGTSPVEDGKLIANEAIKVANQNSSPNFFYMAASPAEEEFYLKGISSVENIAKIGF
ncbi:MAG: hypothetical protein E7208_06430 [Clostridium butyricum]|nr:hypothetical protein [Clostridium butyricum]